MEEFINELKKIKRNIDFENEKNLFDDGLLKSFDIIRIISMITKEYDVTVPPSKIIPENFNSAEAMWKMIREIQEED